MWLPMLLLRIPGPWDILYTFWKKNGVGGLHLGPPEAAIFALGGVAQIAPKSQNLKPKLELDI